MTFRHLVSKVLPHAKLNLASAGEKCRPQFRYAFLVLIYGFSVLVVMWPATLLLSLLGKLWGASYAFNFGALAHIIGPLCVGALISGHIPLIWKTESRLRTFVSSSISGGASVFLFWASLAQQRGGFIFSHGATAFLIGALVFTLIAWLAEQSAAQQIVPADRDKAASAELER